MTPAALRALLVLFAVVCAITAPDRDVLRADVAPQDATCTASPHDESGSDRDNGWQGLAALGEPAPVSVTSSEQPGRVPRSVGERPERIRPARNASRALDPRRCGAFAPGERPAALAFLLVNGSANANGART